jgi:HEPN domain-containing protein
MVDINKHVSYWLSSSDEEFEVAENLFELGRYRHTLFFLHLSLEKLIKGIYCQKTKKLAPKTHNLLLLLESSSVSLNDERRDYFAEMNAFNIEGRYPETHLPLPDREFTLNYFEKSKEARSWLTSLL